MKKRILSALVLCFCIFACSNQASQTKVQGTISNINVDSVRIINEDIKIDKMVPVVNGQFSINLPVDTLSLSTVLVPIGQVVFISDGSDLTIKISDSTSTISSNKPSSPNNLIHKLNSSVEPLILEFANKTKQLSLSTTENMEQLSKIREAFFEQYDDVCKQFVYNHLNSSAVLYPLINNSQLFTDEEFVEIAHKLSPKLQEAPAIVKRLKELNAAMSTAEGSKFVDFTIVDSNGKEVKLSDYVGKGKYVLVDFWASWCGPCKGEIPNLINVYNKYKGDNFDVLGVAVWDKPEDSIKAAKQLGINYPEIINAGNIPTELYNIKGIPQIILFGPDGTILKRGLRGEQIEKEIAKYLGQK